MRIYLACAVALAITKPEPPHWWLVCVLDELGCWFVRFHTLLSGFAISNCSDQSIF